MLKIKKTNVDGSVEYSYELTDRTGAPVLNGEGYSSPSDILNFISQVACASAECFKSNVEVEDTD
jgi:hypothetical protein